MAKKRPSRTTPQPSRPEPEPPPEDPPRGRQSAAPQCPYCRQRCTAGRSTAYFTYYYCPGPACSYSEKQMRPRVGAAPPAPQDDYSAR